MSQGTTPNKSQEFLAQVGRYGLWTAELDALPVSEAVALAQRLEENGWRHLMVPEAVGRDPFVAGTLILQQTSKLVFGTGIASIYARDAMTAKAASTTIASAFPNRFVLGLGVSHEPMVNMLRGHQYTKPLAAMNNYLDRFESALFLANSESLITPLKLLAALGPKMLALSSQRADGAHSYLVTPEHTAQARRTLGNLPLLIPEQAVILTQDRDQARQAARQHLSIYLGLPNYQNSWIRQGFDLDDFAGTGSDRLCDSLVAFGTAESVLARVQAHLEAGADHVVMQILTTPETGNFEAQAQQLADAINLKP